MILVDGYDVMFEGFNRNIIVYEDHGLDNQKFNYNWEKKSWKNKFTGNSIDVMLDKFAID